MISGLSYDERLRFYRLIREQVYDRVRTSLVSRGVFGPQLRLTQFNLHAVHAWGRQWRGNLHWTRKGGFAWPGLQHQYCRKPRNFQVAIWYESTLCGLAVGRVSKTHDRVSLHYMEGHPDPTHPLRHNIADIVFGSAQLYARALDADWLILKNPDPVLVETLYRPAHGFSLAYSVRGITYCRRPVRTRAP